MLASLADILPLLCPATLAAGVLPPVAILALCVVASIGTVLALPRRQEPSIRRIGGVILLSALLIFIALLVRQAAFGLADLYFWIFAAIAIASAVRVITHTRPVYSALYFVLTVVASGGLFVLLWAEFMAAALILIYAGAILITYVFVIMLAQQAQTTSPGIVTAGGDYDQVSREPVIASAIGFLIMGLVLFVIFDRSGPNSAARHVADPAKGTAQALGAYLFTTQVIALELAGVILTLAMVGAIVIARRPVADETAPAGEMAEPLAPGDDNPHNIPVYGTQNPAAKAYPEA